MLLNFLLLFSYSFGYHFIQCDPDITIESKNWKSIEFDWPYLDNVDEDNQSPTEFFYVNNITENQIWKFDNQYIEQLPLKQNQSVVLSFKYWSSAKAYNSEWHQPKIKYYNDEVVYDLYINYREFFTNDLDRFWMPFETTISKEQLKNFQFILFSSDKNAISAIKDIRVEYEVESPANDAVTLFDDNEIIINDFDNKPLATPAPTPAPLKFPENCYLNTTIDERCYPKDFTFDTLNQTFSINVNWDTCFDIVVFTQIQSEIKVMIRSKYNKIQHEIIKLIPGINLDGKNYQTEQLCLNQLSLFYTGEFEVKFEISIPETLKFDNNFAIKFEINPQDKKFYNQIYLSEMKYEDETSTLPNSHKWSDEWDISRHFEANKNSIAFSGTAFAEEKVTAILYSNVWIDLDKELFEKSARINVNVPQKGMFNSFRLKPKICDEFFHCFDMYRTRIFKNGNTETIDFNFNRDINADKIKLIFVVEYFKPSYKFNEEHFDVKFNFTLQNFGNPCFDKNICGTNGICTSNVFSKATNCSCNNDKTGLRCDRIDYCRIKNDISSTIKVSGQKHCDSLDLGYDCISMEKTFRCSCDKENINWNSDTKICDKLKIGKNKNWIVKSDLDDFNIKPENEDNFFEIAFNDIDTDQNICLKVKYKSKKNGILEVKYNGKDPAFNYFLEKGEPEGSIDVCMNDFRLFYDKDFKFQFKVSKIGEKFEENFELLSIIPSLKPKTNDKILIVKKWNEKNKEEWRKFENFDESFTEDAGGWKLKNDITLEKNEFSMTKIMSKWITANNNFSNKDLSYFKIKVDKSKIKSVSVSTKILFNSDEKTVISNSQSNNSSKDDIITYYIDDIPTKIFGYFKVIIEITFKPGSPPNINLNSLSIGDPCFKDHGETYICEPKNNFKSCDPKSPSDKGCTCIDGKAGPECKWNDLCLDKTKNICNKFVYEVSIDDVCHQTSETDIECLCPKHYFTWNGKSCLRNKIYEPKFEECKENQKSCPFLKSFVNIASWADRTLPQIKRNFDKTNLIPFYYTKDKINQISFEKIDATKNDLCLNLNYKSHGKTNISVFYENNNPFQLTKNNEEINQIICVSDLTDQEKRKLKINFRQVQDNDQDMTLINFAKSSVILRKVDVDVSPFMSYDTDVSKKWPFKTPNEEWIVDNSQITFSAQYTGPRESYIFSEWLQPSKREMIFRSLYNKFNERIDFKIEFLIYNNKFESIVINTTSNFEIDKENKTSNFLRTQIKPQATNFKFAIRVKYNQIKEASDLFSLIKIDIGDPCVSNGYELNQCNDHGVCVRNLNLPKGYKCDCNKTENKMKYDGDDCEIANYCDTKIDNGKLSGREFCKDPKTCKNIPGDLKFKCDCPTPSTIWNFTSHECDPIPKCLTFDCKSEQMRCVEADKPFCECKDDYVMPINKTVCELYNPCNKEHRKANREDDTLCSNSKNSFCQPIKYGINSVDEWDCLCNFGFVKETSSKQGQTTCKSVICEYPSMNHCQHKCKPKDNIIDVKSDIYECSCYDGYTLDNKYDCKLNSNSTFKCKNCDSLGKYCESEGNCKCKQGFEEDGNNCKLSNGNVDLKLCPSGKLTNETNGKQHCNCGPGYDFNEKTLKCDLKPICGSGGVGRNNCTLQGKICELTFGKEVNFKCRCLEEYGQEDLGEKCADFCDVIDDDFNTRSDKCKERNAKCNQHLISFPITDKETYKELIQNEDFCECAPGFIKNSDKICVVSKYSSKFTLQFKDESSLKTNCPIQTEFHPNIYKELVEKNEQALIKDMISSNQLNYKEYEKHIYQKRIGCLRQKIEEFIKIYIAKSNYKILKVDSCDKQNNSEYITCNFVIIFDNLVQNNTNMFNTLKSLCNPYDKQNCFVDASRHYYYYSLPDPPTDSQGFMILNNDKLNSITLPANKGCGEVTDKFNPCPVHSNCIQDKDTAYYNCTCDSHFYTSILPAIDLPNADGLIDKKFSIEKCKEKDICPKICNEKGNTCVQKSTQNTNGDWYIQYACNCNGKGINDMPFRNNVTHCTEACDKIQCHNDNGLKQMVGSTCQCVCKEGFYGSGCDSEHSVSKGGWIAGIVVLAVLVVILAGVAFMFARRSRNNSTEYSGRPMDEYTGSSYRVPPNQSRGQQNPSFTRD